MICAVHDLSNFSSLESICDDWVPYIQSLQTVRSPIILVGNKLDLCDENAVPNTKIKFLLNNVRYQVVRNVMHIHTVTVL